MTDTRRLPADELALPPPPPVAERRRALRTTTVMQVAKLIIGRFEELCVVRDVSTGGLKADVYCPVPPGLAAIVELRTGLRVPGRVAWCEDDAIGIAFDQDVSVASVLTHCSLDERIGRVRPPRLQVCIPGSLAIEGQPMPIELRDVSLAGMKVRVGRALEPETPCAIAPDGMEPRPAFVRWHRAGKAGVLFEEPLRFDEFGEWRRTLAERPRRLWLIR